MVTKLKLLRAYFVVVFAVLAGVAAAAGAFQLPQRGPAAFLPALGAVLVGALPFFVLGYQIKALTRAIATVRAAVEERARTLFDEPGAVRPGYDANVYGPMGTFVTTDAESAFTTEGRARGARVTSASLVSVRGRQGGELYHVYSYVAVDVLGLVRPFRIAREGFAAKLGKALGTTQDAVTGDAAFDAAFVVDSETEFARAALGDPFIRQRILELQSKVASVSGGVAHGAMAISLSSAGLALRWPGPLDPELALFVRDLLLDLRGRMLAYEDRRAAAANDAAGYRVSADAIPAAAPAYREPDPPAEEASAELRRS